MSRAETISRVVRTADVAKALLLDLVAIVGRAGLFVALAVCGGIGSAWYVATQPTALTTQRYGPWVAWTAAGRPDADPYTRARFARLGSLPPNAAVVQVFEATTDGSGQRLQSSCEYVVEGPRIAAPWWSIAVYTDRGQLIANPADRHAYNAGSLAYTPDGGYVVTLAREARPGNWLPTGGAGRLMLVLTIHRPPSQLRMAPGSSEEIAQLPAIRRLQCR